MNILQNPLMMISTVFFIAVLVYFSFEIIHGKHKTKEEKFFMKIGWGVLVIFLGVLFIFTPMINALANVSNLLPEDLRGNSYDINKLRDLCNDPASKGNTLFEKYKEDCSYIDYVYYGSLFLAVIGILWILFAVIFELIGKLEQTKKGL